MTRRTSFRPKPPLTFQVSDVKACRARIQNLNRNLSTSATTGSNRNLSPPVTRTVPNKVRSHGQLPAKQTADHRKRHPGKD
jgi:hypothetical protein